MTEHSLWRFSRAFHRAINERQLEELEALIDEDVDWAIYGPIDMFPFLGARRGKAAVLEVIRQIADNVRVHRFDRETIMLGVDSGGLDDALFADRAGLQQADQPAARAFRPVQGRPAAPVSACWSIRSTWWSRRSAVPFTCRGSRRRPEPSLRGAQRRSNPLTFVFVIWIASLRSQWREGWSFCPRHNFAPMCPHRRHQECGRGDDFYDTIRMRRAADAGGRVRHGFGAAGRVRRRCLRTRIRKHPRPRPPPRPMPTTPTSGIWSWTGASSMSTPPRWPPPGVEARLPPPSGQRNVMVIKGQAERLRRGVGEAAAVAVLGRPARRRHDGDPPATDDDVGTAVGKTRQRRKRAAILRHGMGGDHRSRRRLDLGQDGDRSPRRSLAGAEQARHLVQQVVAAERAIFADPAERLQRHPAGNRAGAGHRRAPARNYQTEQSAKLSIADTGTSLIAGQTLSSADDKWLRKVGAEQKLFDGVSISASVGETPLGDDQQEPHRRIQAQLVSADPAAAPAPSRERSSIAAYWPRCGQNRRH